MILLEQNYRSTQNILAAANAVVSRNSGRKPKNLWSEAGDGPPIVGYVANNEHDEAAFVAEEVDRLNDEGLAVPGQVAVFYRTNAQSRVFEEIFIRVGLPYRVVGGVRFYERREVRDLLAYLRLIANPADEVSLRRVLNVPKRGIGERAEEYVAGYASRERISFAQALRTPSEVPGLAARSAAAIAGFNALVDDLREQAATGGPVAELVEAVLDRTGYQAALEASEDLQDVTRVENLQEMVSVAREFDGSTPDGTLADFLERVALVADADEIPDGEQHGGMVTLMTLHTAKGLEFPVVFLTGMEEEVFPHQRALTNPRELEEERRLAYVGITRAEQRLYLTRAASRNWYGPAGVPLAVPVPVGDPGVADRVEARRRRRGRRLDARVGAAGVPAGCQRGRQPRCPGADGGGPGEPRQIRPRHRGVSRRLWRLGRSEDRLRRRLRGKAPGPQVRAAGKALVALVPGVARRPDRARGRGRARCAVAGRGGPGRTGLEAGLGGGSGRRVPGRRPPLGGRARARVAPRVARSPRGSRSLRGPRSLRGSRAERGGAAARAPSGPGQGALPGRGADWPLAALGSSASAWRRTRAFGSPHGSMSVRGPGAVRGRGLRGRPGGRRTSGTDRRRA